MRTFLFLFMSTALLLAGCDGGSDAGRPSDMPQLYPVSITITQGDQPLAGASVTLLAETPSKFLSSATSNASGVATIRTYGYDGAPAGDYTVLVTKVGSENQREERTPEGDVTMVGGQSYRYVDEKFSKQGSTPHNITVTNKGAKGSFDVGVAVRVFLGNNE